MRLQIHQLSKDEVYRGWVRIPEEWRRDVAGNHIPEASVIELTRGGSKLLAIVRGDIESTSATLRLDQTSRKKLGIAEDEIGTSLEISLGKVWLLKKVRFFWSHPEPSSRFATQLALISFVLGMIGLILGVIPMVRAK